MAVLSSVTVRFYDNWQSATLTRKPRSTGGHGGSSRPPTANIPGSMLPDGMVGRRGVQSVAAMLLVPWIVFVDRWAFPKTHVERDGKWELGVTE